MDSISSFYLPISFLIILSLSSPTTAQQAYLNNVCRNSTTPSNLGYSCNGLNRTCQTYFIYRAQPSYDTVSSIASLLSADSSQISKINNISSDTTKLITGKEVIVPFSCSCAGDYYQKNTTYEVKTGDIHYRLSNITFEGLTTCAAIQKQRTGLASDLYPREKIVIPLRCACPTKNQTDMGIKYLISYVIRSGDAISTIALQYGADVGVTLHANEKSDQDSVIEPFTTLLVPLENPPNSNQTRTPSPSPPPPPASAPPTESPPESESTDKRWVYFGEGIAAGGAFVLVLSGILIFLLFKRKTKKESTSKESQLIMSKTPGKQEKSVVKVTEIEPLDILDSLSSIAQSLKIYSFKDLQSATDNFSNNSLIKGSIYKARIDGDQVAIKKMDTDVTAEIELLNKINHFNIISLFGICFHDNQWYLVYEYAANGPLDDWLHGESNFKFLNWIQRLQIALDAATGLDYLHSYTTPPIVHKDVTSSNILLDRDFRAKLANLRLSRSIGGQLGQFTMTEHIVGTQGYLAPEYLENGLVSPKLDVYAFGIFMLEIITGMDIHDLYKEVSLHPSELLSPVLCEGEDGEEKMRGLIDQSLQEKYPTEVAVSIVKLIHKCLSKDPGSRPAMDEIVRFLSKALTTSLMLESSTTISVHTS